MAEEFAVLTITGPDRVGIADDIAKLVGTAGANIEESKMAVLGGDFAVIMLISAKEETINYLEGQLSGMEKEMHLHAELRRTEGREKKSGQFLPYLLESVSIDSPGIVSALTHLLRKYEINIEELDTFTTPAPWTGTPMFTLKALVIVPASCSINRLREELTKLEEKMALDIMFRPQSIKND